MDKKTVLVLQDLREFRDRMCRREKRMPTCPLKARKIREFGSALFDVKVDPLNAEYGKIYLVWASRPTDAQMEAVKWDG